MYAAASGDEASVQALLAAGAPWNAVDKSSRCAGDWAVEYGHEGTAKLLLEAGGLPGTEVVCCVVALLPCTYN